MTLRPEPLVLLLLAAPALATPGRSLELTVAVDASGAQVLSAQPVSGRPDPLRPGTPQLELVDASGTGMGAASLPDPRLRSSIAPPGGVDDHNHVVLERGVVTVRVPWSGETVREARFGGRMLTVPSPPRAHVSPPPAASAIAVQDSGPSEQRLDLVFLSEGYTEGELDDFAADVDRMTDYLLSIEPYGPYADLFNIWRIEVASAESGASHYEKGLNDTRDTAFGCYYGCGGLDRLTCCDDDRVMTTVGQSLPGADGIMVLINDDTYGGSGGFNYATSYTGRDYSNQVAAHELGHSLVGLWDEYGYGGSGSGDGPNCTSNPEGAWDSWKGTNGVDAFPECSYSNLYRPTPEACMMRNLGDDYCPVCRQEAVLEMYRRLPELVAEASHPEGGERIDAIGTEAGDVVLSVTPHAPEELLRFEWFLDGEPVGEDRAELPVSCSDLNGEVTLFVSDPTPWVRDDPDQLLSQRLGPWSVASEACAAEETTEPDGVEPGRRIGERVAEGCQTSPGPVGLLTLLPVWFLRSRRG